MSRLDEIRERVTRRGPFRVHVQPAGWDADVAWLLARIDAAFGVDDARGNTEYREGWMDCYDAMVLALTGEDPA